MSADEFETWAAAYVLGALSPADRSTFVDHLGDCASCRARVDEVAGLPGLLSRVEPDDLIALDDERPPLPATLLPGLLHAVERAERRRWWVSTALVAVAACTVLLTVLGIAALRPDSTPPPASVAAATPIAMRPVVDAPIAASVGITSVGWGTRVGLRCTYSGDDGVSRPYALVVVGSDGRKENIGTWTAAPGSEVRLTGATALRGNQIAAVEVQSQTGVALLRADNPVTAPAQR